MKKTLEFIRKLKDSTGFCPARMILTAIYIAVLIYSAPLFTASVGNYPVQMASFVLFAGSLALLIRSVKRLFDRRTVDKISKFLGKVSARVDRFFAKIGRKISKALGLDRMKGYGEEHDFIFNERRGRSRKHAKLRNPNFWEDQQDNSEKVRYIFTDYMIRMIKDGYKFRGYKTPADMQRELAHEDNENLLFDTYSVARYSGGREPVEDSTIEALADFADSGTRKKIMRH